MARLSINSEPVQTLITGKVIRHQNSRGRIDAAAGLSPIADGNWNMVPGLAGGYDLVGIRGKRAAAAAVLHLVPAGAEAAADTGCRTPGVDSRQRAGRRARPCGDLATRLRRLS